MRQHIWGAFIATCAILTSGIVAAPDRAMANTPTVKSTPWHAWFEIGGYHNSRDEDSTGTSGTNRGETSIFVPIAGGNRTLLFGQLTGKFFDDSVKEGNLALGYRQMTPWGFNLGAWIGGDMRRTDIDNTFKRVSGGFEALSKNVDLRFNWYGPINDPQPGVAGYAQLRLDGNQIYIIGGEEIGLKGVDGEIGFRLPTEFANLDPNIFELRAYAGGYHFRHSDTDDDVTGVKGRLELRVNDIVSALPGSRLTAEYAISNDDLRGTRHDVGLRIRIPLSGGQTGQSDGPSLASLSHQQRRMLDGIERETDILTGRSTEPVEDALTGTDFDRVAYASASSDVTTTANAAGDNSLIILNGTIVIDTVGQVLKANQTLQGGGSTIDVRGRRSGIVLPFTAPGAAAAIKDTSTTTDPLVRFILTMDGSNSHVAGITFRGAPNSRDAASRGRQSGIGIDDTGHKENVFITNSQFFNLRVAGVTVNGENEVTIIDSSFDGINDYGVEIVGNNAVTIASTTIKNIGKIPPTAPSNFGVGIIAFGANHVTISDVLIDNVVRGVIIGSTFGGDVETRTVITDTTISNASDSAIIFNGLLPNTTLLLSNTTFAGEIGEHIFTVTGGAIQVEDGSVGNVNNTTSVGGRICEVSAALASFTGEIELSGTILVDNDGGADNCN